MYTSYSSHIVIEFFTLVLVNLIRDNVKNLGEYYGFPLLYYTFHKKGKLLNIIFTEEYVLYTRM